MFERIKAHVIRHKVVYSFGATVVIVGITCLIVRGRLVGVHSVPSGLGTAETPATVRPLLFFSNIGSRNSVVSVLEREGRGHPGYLVHELGTDRGFLSQNAAAQNAGVSKSMMSSHLTKNIPDNINGRHFERLVA